MTLPHVLFTDGLSAEGRAILEPHHGKLFNLEICELLSDADLKQKIKNASVICVRTKTQFTPELFKHVNKLKLIGRIGIGVDHIDLQSARKNKVAVMTVGDANATSVAELTVGFTIAFSRKIPMAVSSMKAGYWNPKELSGFELSRKTFGIVGLGRIGSRVARRMQAMDMRVIACDPYIDTTFSERFGIRLHTLEEVLAESHVTSLHIPLTSETRGIIHSKILSKARKGLYLINTARGEVVDQSAIIESLDNETLAGYAADVFSEEPLAKDDVLRFHPKALLTPHYGAQTKEAQKRANEVIAKQIVHYFRTGEIQNRVD